MLGLTLLYLNLNKMNLLRWFLALSSLCIHKCRGDVISELFDPSRYNPKVRPVLYSSDAVNVTFGLAIMQLEELDDKNQLLIMRTGIRESWKDPLLTWDPANHSGLEYISVPPDKIWIPDIVLYNNAGDGFGQGVTRTNAVIRYDGLVSMNIPSIIKSSCRIHVADYPFDQQDCKMKFGSWTFDAAAIALVLEQATADLSDYQPSAQWELVEAPGEFHSIVYSCCPNPYHDITYTIRLKRQALYYAMYLIIPCAMISFLNLLVFLLPPDCNERMTVGMAILVGLSFFFLLVAENMPATSEAVPLVAVYYTVTMIEVSCAFFMTCWVLRFHHHNPTDGDLPQWLRVFLLGYAARYLGFQFDDDTPNEEKEQQKDTGNENLGVSLNNLTDDDKRTLIRSRNGKQSPIATTPPDKRNANSILVENIQQQEIMEARQEEWKKAALVMNNLFMWIYVFAVVVSGAAIFLKSPVV